MAIQIQQVWPSSITVFYDPTVGTPVSYEMPYPPMDSQEVELVNIGESDIEIVLHATGRLIVDPLTHQIADNCELAQSRAATRFKYRSVDNTWYPLNVENEYSSLAINTYDLVVPGKIKASKGARTIEAISPGTVELDHPAVSLRQKLTIKNSCPEDTDLVIVSDASTTVDEIAFDSARTEHNIPLLRGDAVTLQAFSTYWLVVSFDPAAPLLKQQLTPYEITPSDRMLEIIGGPSDYVVFPDPSIFVRFTIDQPVTIKNSRSGGGAGIKLVSHYTPASYTITMVDLGGGLFGVTSSMGSSSGFVFLDQTWTSMHADAADDTFHFVMPAQPGVGANDAPRIRVRISGLGGVRLDRYFDWDSGTSRFTGSWPGIHAALADTTWPHIATIWPIGIPGNTSTIKVDDATMVDQLSIASGESFRFILDTVNDVWLRF